MNSKIGALFLVFEFKAHYNSRNIYYFNFPSIFKKVLNYIFLTKTLFLLLKFNNYFINYCLLNLPYK